MKPIRVAFETQYAFGMPTGLGTYARKLAEALRARSDIELMEMFDPDFNVWRFDRRVYWDQAKAPRLARRIKPDLTHFTGGTLPWQPPHPCVVTVHDLAWLSGAVKGRAYSRAYFRAVARRALRNADRVAADTATAREELVRYTGLNYDSIAVTGAGVDPEWFAIERRVADPPFVLAVGTVEPRKDLETAIRAVAALPGVRLVSAGAPTPYLEKARAVAQQNGVADRVRFYGYVDDATLRLLYSEAAALVFPSTYEGFGLPPLQALAARVPVIASDIPVVREVLGECALFVPPRDAEGFADALRRALREPAAMRPMSERGVMRAREFTWQRVAQRTFDLYRSVLSG